MHFYQNVIKDECFIAFVILKKGNIFSSYPKAISKIIMIEKPINVHNAIKSFLLFV